MNDFVSNYDVRISEYTAQFKQALDQRNVSQAFQCWKSGVDNIPLIPETVSYYASGVEIIKAAVVQDVSETETEYLEKLRLGVEVIEQYSLSRDMYFSDNEGTPELDPNEESKLFFSGYNHLTHAYLTHGKYVDTMDLLCSQTNTLCDVVGLEEKKRLAAKRCERLRDYYPALELAFQY